MVAIYKYFDCEGGYQDHPAGHCATGHTAGCTIGGQSCGLRFGFPGTTGPYATFDSAQLLPGKTRSCRMRHYAAHPLSGSPPVPPGCWTDDIGETSGMIGFGNDPALWPAAGDEFWYRVYTYLQSPWIFGAQYWLSGEYPGYGGGGEFKLLRLQTKKETTPGSGVWTVNTGLISIYVSTSLNPASADAGQIRISIEPFSGPEVNTGVYLDLDRWQCIEYNVLLDPTAGHFRIWKDGVLITMDVPGYAHGYFESIPTCDINARGLTAMAQANWNGGCPGDWQAGPGVAYQDQWMDYVQFQTAAYAVPTALDAYQNPMIGPIGWGFGPGQQYYQDPRVGPPTKGFNEQGRRIRPASGTTYTEGGGR